MNRDLPGTVFVEGREFAYLESTSAEDFAALFLKITTFGSSPMPQKGSAINENLALLLPNRKRLFALSYKGDLEGWRRKICECSEQLQVLRGTIDGDQICLSDGSRVDLEECIIEDGD